MRIIIEEVDEAYYQDVIIDAQDIDRLKAGEVIEGQSLVKGRRLHVGLRIGEKWRLPSEKIIHGEFKTHATKEREI